MAQLSRQTSLSRGKPVDSRQAIEKLNHFQGHEMAETETICRGRDNKQAREKTHARTSERIIGANIRTLRTFLFFLKGFGQITLQGK